jgi:cell division protein FtsA
MAHENYIVAIDLGTSHLVGMVGKKSAEGTLSILADEIEVSASCIRRGCVYNVEDTALKINRLIAKLQNKLSSKLPDFKIEKVYIGVGGQSLHAIKHKEVIIINTDAVVTDEDIAKLDEQCHAYKPDMLDVLGVSSPAYYANGTLTEKPSGVACKRIEAHYSLIVGKPAIRNNIVNCINRAKLKLAGIMVSPMALADAIFNQDEKELGCALIDFGAGVTSVVVYKQKELVHLSVIPFGGNSITKDLTSLRLVESQAEQLKITYGSAVKEKNAPLDEKEGIALHKINTVVEARVKEIVENVYAQVKSTGKMEALEKIVLAGGASSLKNLPELVRERFKKEVCFSTIRKEWMEDNDDRIGDPRYMTAISLLLKGTVNCVLYDPPLIIKSDLKPLPDQPPSGDSFFTKIWREFTNPD